MAATPNSKQEGPFQTMVGGSTQGGINLKLAGMASQCARDMAQLDLLDTHKATTLRRTWERSRRRTGVDMTCGLSDTLAQLLRLEMTTMTPPAQGDIDSDCDGEGEDESGGGCVEEDDEKEVMAFTANPENLRGLPCMEGMEDCSISTAAVAGYTVRAADGQWQWVCNQRWAYSFMNQIEASQHPHATLLPWYTMAQVVSEADQERFMRRLVQYMIGKDVDGATHKHELDMVLKVQDRCGMCVPALVRVRSGRWGSMIMSIIPLSQPAASKRRRVLEVPGAVYVAVPAVAVGHSQWQQHVAYLQAQYNRKLQKRRGDPVPDLE